MIRFLEQHLSDQDPNWNNVEERLRLKIRQQMGSKMRVPNTRGILIPGANLAAGFGVGFPNGLLLMSQCEHTFSRTGPQVG